MFGSSGVQTYRHVTGDRPGQLSPAHMLSLFISTLLEFFLSFLFSAASGFVFSFPFVTGSHLMSVNQHPDVSDQLYGPVCSPLGRVGVFTVCCYFHVPVRPSLRSLLSHSQGASALQAR